MYAALQAETKHVALENGFCGNLDPELGLQPCVDMGGGAACRVYKLPDGVQSGPPPSLNASKGVHTHYWMDLASVLPAMLLNAGPGMNVLDMCAAPGGKTLLLAHALFTPHASASASAPEQGQGEPSTSAVTHVPVIKHGTRLVANELDRGRRARLQKVLSEYLPIALVGQGGGEDPSPVQVTGYAADVHWGRKEGATYQRVLLDAPCTSERHVVQQSATKRGVIASSAWSVAGCKKAAELQCRLLVAGLRALAVGGRMVYSTCSLAPIENDGVVAQALTRVVKGSVRVLPPDEAASSCGCTYEELARTFGASKTQHGVLCTPDSHAACGPIYAAVLVKTGETEINRHVLLRRAADDDGEDYDDDSSEEEEDEQEQGGDVQGGAGEGAQ